MLPSIWHLAGMTRCYFNLITLPTQGFSRYKNKSVMFEMTQVKSLSLDRVIKAETSLC